MTVGNNLRVVERHVIRQAVQSEPAGFRRIISGTEFAARLCNEDNGDGMESRVTTRLGIDPELTKAVRAQPRLFKRFPFGSLLYGLAIVDEASRQRPTRRRILPTNEQDLAGAIEEDIHGRTRIAEGLDLASAVWASDSGFHRASGQELPTDFMRNKKPAAAVSGRLRPVEWLRRAGARRFRGGSLRPVPNRGANQLHLLLRPLFEPFELLPKVFQLLFQRVKLRLQVHTQFVCFCPDFAGVNVYV